MEAKDELTAALRAALQAQQQRNVALAALQQRQPTLFSSNGPLAALPAADLVSTLLESQRVLDAARWIRAPIAPPPSVAMAPGNSSGLNAMVLSPTNDLVASVLRQALPSSNTLLRASLPDHIASLFTHPSLVTQPTVVPNSLQASLLQQLTPARPATSLHQVLYAVGRKPDRYIDVLSLPGISQLQPVASNDQSFSFRLHVMLSNLPPGLEKIISFCSHGRALIVHDRDQVVDKVLQQYFNQTKLASFHRQLGLWGFRRICNNTIDNGAYYHPLFLRGHAHLCAYMKRSGLKKTQQPAIRTSSPDFSAMRVVG